MNSSRGRQMPTPAYTYDLEQAVATTESLRHSLRDVQVPVQIAFAVKAAPLPVLIACLAACCDRLELMSEWETSLARASGSRPAGWIVNAPGATPAFLLELLRTDCDLIVSTFAAVRALADPPGEQPTAGALLVRMHDAEGELSPSHGFLAPGESWRAAAAALVPARRNRAQGGLHFHSKKPDALASPRFRAAVRGAWEQLADVWGSCEVLNVGGGLPSPSSTSWHPGVYRAQLCELIDELEPRPQRLVVEPGTHLVADAGRLDITVTGCSPDGQLWVDGSARLLPEQRGMWNPSAQAPLRFSGNGGTSHSAAIRGPLCQGSDRFGSVADPDWRGFQLDDDQPRKPGSALSIEGAGAYHLALASGLHGGGTVEARVLVRGIGTCARRGSSLRGQLDTAGWAVISHPGTGDVDTVAELLRATPRTWFPECGYEPAAEIWATIPHTDGARLARPPDLLALRMISPDRRTGEDFLVSADQLAYGLLRGGREDLLALARQPVPFAGGDAFPLLTECGQGWRIRLFRPMVDWMALAADPGRYQAVTELVTWLESLAVNDRTRIAVDLDADQMLVLDNRKFVHWRAMLDKESGRRWERWYLDVAE